MICVRILSFLEMIVFTYSTVSLISTLNHSLIEKTLNVNEIEVDFKSLSLWTPFLLKRYSVSFFTDFNPKIKRHYGSMQGIF